MDFLYHALFQNHHSDFETSTRNGAAAELPAQSFILSLESRRLAAAESGVANNCVVCNSGQYNSTYQYLMKEGF